MPGAFEAGKTHQIHQQRIDRSTGQPEFGQLGADRIGGLEEADDVGDRSIVPAALAVRPTKHRPSASRNFGAVHRLASTGDDVLRFILGLIDAKRWSSGRAIACAQP
jgi:hypothetical protein